LKALRKVENTENLRRKHCFAVYVELFLEEAMGITYDRLSIE